MSASDYLIDCRAMFDALLQLIASHAGYNKMGNAGGKWSLVGEEKK
jgi:hypothetical protein